MLYSLDDADYASQPAAKGTVTVLPVSPAAAKTAISEPSSRKSPEPSREELESHELTATPESVSTGMHRQLKKIWVALVTLFVLSVGVIFLITNLEDSGLSLDQAQQKIKVLSGMDATENARVYAIMMMPIDSEKKEVLINRQVFPGCTPEMVRLALGEPTRIDPGAPEVWHYPENSTRGALSAEFTSSVLSSVTEQPRKLSLQ